MSFERLQPDVWPLVLRFLAVPRFKPLSGCTKEEAVGEDAEMVSRLPNAGDPGAITRKDIRANDLATLMRTSQAFNMLASNLLYNRVVCDNLSLLISQLDNPPAHPLIPSKAQLLSRIHHLHLEYSYKGSPVSYVDFMMDKRHRGAFDLSSSESVIMYRVNVEIQQLCYCIGRLNDRGSVFCGLVNLSVASLFGPQHGVWGRVITQDGEKVFSERVDRIKFVGDNLQRVFQTEELAAWCQRGYFGPLALPVTSRWNSHVGRTPLLTAHLDEHTSHLPAIIGGKTRWVLEQYLHEEHFSMMAFYTLRVHHDFRKLVRMREGDSDGEKGIDLGVYASTRRTTVARQGGDDTAVASRDIQELTVAEERAEHRRYLGGLVTSFSEMEGWNTQEADIHMLHPLPDASPCAGCGWAFDERDTKGTKEWLEDGGGWFMKWTVEKYKLAA